MGFDGLFFARADYREKDQRKANKTLQMIWQGSGKEEGHESEIVFEILQLVKFFLGEFFGGKMLTSNTVT